MNPGNGGWAILLSILLAMLLMVVHLPESWPAWLGWLRPHWLLLVVYFWVVELPHRVGLIAVWLLGLLVDALLAHPLGLNGFILAATTYVGWRFFERLRMYSVLQQCVVLFFLVLGAQLLQLFVMGFFGERQFSWGIIVVALSSMFAWPVVYLLLLRVRTSLRVE